MLDQLVSIISLVMILLAAYGLGRPVLAGLKLGEEDQLTVAVLSLGVGLILSGTLLAALGLAGLLDPPLILILTLAGCASAVRCLTRNSSPAIAESTGTLPATVELETCGLEGGRGLAEIALPSGKARIELYGGDQPARWLRQGLIALACLACLGSLVGALAPPTAGDALCYHIELPKAWLADRAITFLPDSDNSTFPLLVEMWYLWGLALDGPVATGLIHWACGILLALATVVLATPIVGRCWAWGAGAVVLLVPGVNNQMTAPLNDVAMAMLATLALAAWWRAVAAEEGRRWCILAGLAGGGALGTKYVALVFAMAVAAHAAWTFARRPQSRRLILEGTAVVAVIALSVGGLWYLRAAWHRGNPVYPFLSEAFHQGAHPPERGTLPPSKSPLGRNPLGIVTAAWHITMNPERFGGRGHQLGIVLPLALPGLLLVRRLRGLGMLLAVAGTYWVIWFLLRQNVRFLLPIVPLLAVAAVWVWMEMRRLPALQRLVAAATFAVVLFASTGVALVRCRDQLPVAVGWQSRADYLAHHEPTWFAANLFSELARDDARLLTQDYRAFYFDGRVTRENLYRQRTHYDRLLESPEDLSRHLRAEGFTHLLLVENLSSEGMQFDPTLTRLAESQWSAEGHTSLVPLIDYRFADSDGGLRRYRLVMLR